MSVQQTTVHCVDFPPARVFHSFGASKLPEMVIHREPIAKRRLNTSSARTSKLSSSRFLRTCGQACLKTWLTFVNLVVTFRAILVRLSFICFTLTAIYFVVQAKGDTRLWLLLVTVTPLLIDMIMAIRLQTGNNDRKWTITKWFSLCNFAYLICACPPIWILELHHMDQVNNVTSQRMLPFYANYSISTPEPILKTTLPLQVQKRYNVPGNESMVILGENISQFILSHERFVKQAADNLFLKRAARNQAYGKIPLMLPPVLPVKDNIRVLEQLLLLSVIMGRWLMPRDGITRDQLSQLLLINIGTAADILELFEAFNESGVRTNAVLRTAILCLWQASLIQFCFNKTAIRDPRSSNRSNMLTSLESGLLSINDETSPGTTLMQCPEKNCYLEMQTSNKRGFCCPRSNNKRSSRSDSPSPRCFAGRRCPIMFSFFCKDHSWLCFETELWAIGVSLLLQDVPFLLLRLTLIFYFQITSYSNVFFTCKNTLLITLQVFRSVVIVSEAIPKKPNSQKKETDTQMDED